MENVVDSARTQLRILLAGGSDALAQQLRDAIGAGPVEVTRCALDELAPSLWQMADVVAVRCQENPAWSGFLQPLQRGERGPAVFALLDDTSHPAIRAALRAGAQEVLFLPLRAEEVTRALVRVLESRPEATSRARGMVCTLLSLNGGAGVTTVAINLALALRQALGRKVALLDLDLQAADIATQLNLECSQTLLEVARAERLDSIQLEAALTRHRSGVYVLAAPARLEEAERIDTRGIARVIALMREIFDFVIVDSGRHVDDRTVAAWESSDRLLYVLNQTLTSVRRVWALLELVQRLEVKAPAPELLLNRVRRDSALKPAQIANTLGRPIAWTIPAGDKELELAEESAADLWKVAPGATVTRSFQQLAAALAGQAAAGGRKRNRLLALPLLRVLRTAP
jgi:pilus assembly protein CpaE